ncbi:MAG: hypothetical protein A2X64_06020 [Ignavibacteria bacterium GWF2_33_9]|nr:MAG: hypothetical protein A2X64_06020 [Ignavibacteria bacterium GWF2_33_9]
MKKILLILGVMLAFTSISYSYYPFCIQCPEVPFQTGSVSFTTPDGCQVSVLFGWRDVSCPPPNYTHQVLIYGFVLVNPGCEAYTLDNSTLRDLAVPAIYNSGQLPANWIPLEGDCYDNYEFVSWGCMYFDWNYQGPGPTGQGSSGWFPCDLSECCINHITVCRTNNQIVISSQQQSTVSCEEGEAGCTSQCP